MTSATMVTATATAAAPSGGVLVPASSSSTGGMAGSRKRRRQHTVVVTPSPSPIARSGCSDWSTSDEDSDADEPPPQPRKLHKSQSFDSSSTASHRDEIVAAILTIASALGLSKETLHVCVDLLDRYLRETPVKTSELETISIACLWIAIKFMETPSTIASKSIKQILKRRSHSGNWSWSDILRQEATILEALEFRIISPTILSVLQRRLHAVADDLSPEQLQLAHYFADLLLLRHRALQFDRELLVEAIWFIVQGFQIADVEPPLLAPVLLLFLAHRDIINPAHGAFKTWFALRCQYGPFLPAPWQVPFDPRCGCRVCEHVHTPPPTTTRLSKTTTTTKVAAATTPTKQQQSPIESQAPVTNGVDKTAPLETSSSTSTTP